MCRNLLVETRQDLCSLMLHGGRLRRKTTGTLIWTAATKAALSQPDVHMGVLILLPLFAAELPRTDILRLEYVLGK